MKGKDQFDFRLVKTVALWEFSRWFKWKDQFITLALSAAISLILFGGQSVLRLFSDPTRQVTIIGGSMIGFHDKSMGDIVFLHTDSSAIEYQRNALYEKQIDGLLIFINSDTAELFVHSDPSWFSEAHHKINEARTMDALRRSNIASGFIEKIFNPVEIKIKYTGIGGSPTSLGEMIAAGVFIGLMLLGVFIGLAYQFIAVTGEKQTRITEVIVSAVSPQTWIDGKIIGISLLSSVLLITYTAGAVVFIIISSLFGSGWSLPATYYDPGLIFLLAIFSIGGFLLWNTVFTAIAATINDPNTSSRGVILFLPIIPTALAAMSMKTPDSPLMIFLSLFPLTSAPAMSLRLVLTSVPAWEIVLSLALIAATVLFFRKSAGIIFSLSILMYGKEPSWREMLVWLKSMKKNNKV